MNVDQKFDEAGSGAHTEELSYDGEVFNTKEIRLGFIRKVYLILSVQLLVTCGAVLLTYNVAAVRDFQNEYFWLYYVCIVVTIVTLYAIGCYKRVARSVPLNYSLLAVFTVCESYVVSALTAYYSSNDILIATLFTGIIVIALTIYALTTNTDFTMWGGALFIFGFVLIFGSIMSFFWRNNLISIALSMLWAVLFGLYLVYDTQLIVGNKENRFEIDDYVFAAISLYLDIIGLFLQMLSLVSNKG